ncbi:transcriptional regulator [Patescibacteria group bacterium]|nr:transcriptional regulator [Patescibacteria group bacterium]
MDETPTPTEGARKDPEMPLEIQRLIEAFKLVKKDPSADNLSIFEIAVDSVIDATKRRRRILSLVQDALTQLRLDMKYLMFDLEATRRERDEARQELKDQQSDD